MFLILNLIFSSKGLDPKYHSLPNSAKAFCYTEFQLHKMIKAPLYLIDSCYFDLAN